MNMKKYTADTMVNAMKKVRADFGDDAIILSSNVVQSKGIFGLFKKKTVEVVAGYDAPKKSYEPKIEPTIQQSNQLDDTTKQLKQEMSEMKKMLKNMQLSTELSQYPDEMHQLLHHLKRQGISEQLVGELGTTIFNQMKDEKQDLTIEEQCRHVQQILTEKVEGLPFGGITFQKKYIHVLGPTGVGKTTTIAKIAARALLEKKKKIGFITTDTYRIAAIEQLRTYANLLQAPVEVVYNQADFKKAVEKFSYLDLVFIDTAGRNYKEAEFVEDLQHIVDFSLDMETFLVLSMTSKEEDMEMIIEQFKALPIEKFIFTKMDETNSMGTLFNLMLKYGYGTAYFTNGQEVPEDLEEATPENVIQLLLGDLTNA
ncbi:flagellar biosynthesis protein FlhF [Sporosarcina ureilytica]|uniref:Flagellar biosynthesis protein FlhF n=1 Tax=Sporosarcina ureilytica TaxID=298596 RepID=A0A1D8JHU4_9BACL|nr:flagellar biosynthesis protein FlhF [Sporosarcina ureilytica]AOV08253.1 flagellar biosynthesis protein FlhF [Sporosarcina ureilytica]